MPLIDRTAKAALDTNLNNGVTSDAPKLKASDDVVYDTIDANYTEFTTHRDAATLAHPDGSVTTAKLANGAVTTAKIATGAVTNEKVADGTLTAAKFVAGALSNETQNALNIVALKADTAQRAINVKSAPYNAKGDNLTDDTAAIQAAIDAVAAAGGGIVFFPTGNYIVSDTLTIPAGPVSLQGVGNYETSKGTRIQWNGGNSTTMFVLGEYNAFEKLFIYKGNSAIGVTCIDMNNAEIASAAAHITMFDVGIKGFAVGMDFQYTWFDVFIQVTVSYCTTGVQFGIESNNIDFFGCHVHSCTDGIKATAGSRQVLFSGCDFESNSNIAVDMSDDGASAWCTNWAIRDCYFEANAQSMRVNGFNCVIDNLFINHDYVNQLTNAGCFVFVGASYIEFKNIYFSADIPTDKGILFTGTLTNNNSYQPNGLVIHGISQHYLAKAVETYPDIVKYNHLNAGLSDVEIVLTERMSSASGQQGYVIPYLFGAKYANKKLVKAYILTETDIVISGTMTVNVGTTFPYTDIIEKSYSGVTLSGIYELPLLVNPPTVTPTITEYKFNNDPVSGGGDYRMMFVFVG